MTNLDTAGRGVAGHGMGGPADFRRPASRGAQPWELPPGALERDVRRAYSVLRRVAANPFIPVRPTPHQLAFLLADEREVLLTGTGGCGKTVGLLAVALLDVDRLGYRALLVQRTLAGPVSLSELAREWLEGTAASWDSNARLWRFPSGASLDFGHERYLYTAGEYHAIFVDDLTNFADHEYRRLFQVWRRRQGSTTAMRVRIATSPGGPGHDWVRERFAIDNPGSVLPLGRRVLVATMDDNPHLDREEYRQSLANLDPVRRAQLETGDWSIRRGGAIFLIRRKAMADVIRRRVGRLKDEAGLPLARSVHKRYVQRSFWSPDDYRVVIDGYIRRGRSNLAVAERLAQEAKVVHDVVIDVPTLFDDRGAS